MTFSNRGRRVSVACLTYYCAGNVRNGSSVRASTGTMRTGRGIVQELWGSSETSLSKKASESGFPLITLRRGHIALEPLRVSFPFYINTVLPKSFNDVQLRQQTIIAVAVSLSFAGNFDVGDHPNPGRVRGCQPSPEPALSRDWI